MKKDTVVEQDSKIAGTTLPLAVLGIWLGRQIGLVHLPQLMSYGAGSPFAIWATIIGNSLVGTMYGWCYWRRSFIAAVIAHFSVDLVIHALPALVT